MSFRSSASSPIVVPRPTVLCVYALLLGSSALTDALPHRVLALPLLALVLIQMLSGTLLLAARRPLDSSLLQGRRILGLVVLLCVGIVVDIAATPLLFLRASDAGVTGLRFFLACLQVWFCIFLLFGIGYWVLGNAKTSARRGDVSLAESDWLFIAPDEGIEPHPEFELSPGADNRRMLNYLYLSALNSVSIAPRDVIVISRRARWILMVQTLAALGILGVLIFRFVTLAT